jgi:hypothetical protein
MADTPSLITGAAIGLSGGVVTAFASALWSRSQAREARIHDQRREAYVEFLTQLYRVFDRMAQEFTNQSVVPASSPQVDYDAEVRARALIACLASKKIKALVIQCIKEERAFYEAGGEWTALVSPTSSATAAERLAAWNAIQAGRLGALVALKAVEEQITAELEHRE